MLNGKSNKRQSVGYDEHLLTTEELDPKELQIIFRRIGDYATDVVFHRIHFLIPLDKINQVSSLKYSNLKKKGICKKCASLTHYEKDN
jgi:hypothetical protein